MLRLVKLSPVRIPKMGQHFHCAYHAFFFFLLIPQTFRIKTMSHESRVIKMLDPELVNFNVCLNKPNKPSSEERYGLSPSKNPFVLGKRYFVKPFVFIRLLFYADLTWSADGRNRRCPW